MKKFVVIDSIGKYEGNTINGSVERMEIVAESNEREELFQMMKEKFDNIWGGTEYRANGEWHSMKIETRVRAKEYLNAFGKAGK